MFVIPAIDLQGGQCVRLKQGVASDSTVYGSDPVAMAKQWEDAGGTLLHVVDLDGAFQGRPAHTDVIAQIAEALSIPVEVGGGIRDDAAIRDLLSAGVRRVILGTRACENPDEIAATVESFGDAIAVGIDARDGLVQTKGWVTTTEVRSDDLARSMDAAGVATIIYTDTSRDGMLTGPNTGAVSALCEKLECDVIASGGVSTIEDVVALQALPHSNLRGVIVGKALYEGTLQMSDVEDGTH